jgi:hypothetical protein
MLLLSQVLDLTLNQQQMLELVLARRTQLEVALAAGQQQTGACASMIAECRF